MIIKEQNINDCCFFTSKLTGAGIAVNGDITGAEAKYKFVSTLKICKHLIKNKQISNHIAMLAETRDTGEICTRQGVRIRVCCLLWQLHWLMKSQF
jgi:hypothetical protein